MPQRAQRLADILADVLEGDPWYGAPLKFTLQGVTAVTAAARPLEASHTIWEIVCHIDAWNRVCLRRIAGESDVRPPVDFPVPETITPGEWRQVQVHMDESCRRVIAQAAQLSEAQLASIVPGKDYTVHFLIEGVCQHWIYHSGQIAILRRALMG